MRFPIVRWRRAAFGALTVLAAVFVVQVVNTRTVRGRLCQQLASSTDCQTRSGVGSVDFNLTSTDQRPSGKAPDEVLRVSTWLLRQSCKAGWEVGVGGRANVSNAELKTRMGVIQIQDACVSTNGRNGDGSLGKARVEIDACTVQLDQLRFSAARSVDISFGASVQPNAISACTALFPDAMKEEHVTAAVARSTIRGTIHYETSDGSPATKGLIDAREHRDVSRVLTRMKTAHIIDAALGRDSLAIRIETVPTANSATVRLTVRATPAFAGLLPADAISSKGARVLTLAWDLRHASQMVRVNGKDRQRRPIRPSRASGRVRLPASECGPAATADRSLYFVEADDRGHALLPEQATKVHDAVERAMGGGGALVTVFVHGWQHSAAAGDSYVCRFADITASIVQMEADAAKLTGRPPRQVLGVYAGWPGEMYDSPLANTATTFWDRLNAADSLGGENGVLRAVLARLSRQVLPGRADVRADRRSSLIVVGHSMGARAVFHAVRDNILLQNPESGATPDVTVLVNPAFSANLYRAVHNSSSNCRSTTAPVLLFSSESDAVTRQVYPAGQALNYDPAAPQQPPILEHLYTAANFREFVTHRLTLDSMGGPPPALDGAQTILRGALRVPAGSRELYDDSLVVVYRQPEGRRPRPSDAWYRLRLSAVPGVPVCASQRMPSRVVAVDPQVIPDHGRIFTPPFVEYLARVLNAQASAPSRPRE